MPSTEDVPPRATLGSCTITPLLSRGRSAAGFWTWLDKGNGCSAAVRPVAGVIAPVVRTVGAGRPAVLREKADPQDAVESGGCRSWIRIGASGGTGAEGGIDDLYRDLNRGFIRQDDARGLHGPPQRRAVAELDALGNRAGSAGHLRKRDGQRLFEDPQSVTSRIEQDVVDRLAGRGPGGANGHADAGFVEIGVRRTERAVDGDGDDIIRCAAGHRQGG